MISSWGPFVEKSLPTVLIHCDRTTTIEKTENHYYNDKRQEIRCKHNTIWEIVTNSVTF